MRWPTPDSQPSVPRVSGAVYLENWDRLRVIAALDTVAHHLAGQHALFGFGLPLFLMLSIALGVSKREPPPTERFLRRRFERVIVPWVFWSLVIAGLRGWFTFTRGEDPFGWFEWSMLFYGPRIHLWFLPAVIVFGFLAHLAHHATWRLPASVVAVPALLLGALLLPLPPGVYLGWPYEQWLFSVPAIPLGFALGRFISGEPDVLKLRWTLAKALLLFSFVAAIMGLLSPTGGEYVLRFIGGFGLLALATWLPNRRDPYTRHVAPLMLGVYVWHPGIFAIFVEGPLRTLGLADFSVLRVASGFLATMLLVWILRLVPTLRKVL